MSQIEEDKISVEKQPETEEKQTADLKGKTDFLESYKGLSDTTSKIVQKATEILETEIEAGIKAAKKAEEQFINVEKIRSEKPDEVIQRFRRDAHEVVDILVDVVSTGLRSLNVSNVVSITNRTGASKTEQQPQGQTAQIKPTKSIKAGEKAEIPLSFENSGDSQTDEFKLYNTDLIGETGEKIPSNRIKFEPSTLRISPHTSAKVVVTIAVPKTTKPGVYYGMVLAANMNQLRSEIIIKVV
jgi:hypothetical protein